MRDIQREAETQAEGKAGSIREPDVGLDPGSLGSHPGLQAAPNRCTTRTAPSLQFLTSSNDVLFRISLNTYIFGHSWEGFQKVEIVNGTKKIKLLN